MYNQTEATTSAQNVAINGTAFKQYAASFTNEIGPTWGGNFVCNDTTGRVNPSYSCIGAEFNSYVLAGASTDSNKARVGVQISVGPTTFDAGVHIGRALLIAPGNGATIDNAVEILDYLLNVRFLVEGSGATTITSNKGSWSSSNIGKQLIIQTISTATNPGIGIADLNGTNYWAIANNATSLSIQEMPALSNSATAPVVAVSFPRNKMPVESF